MQYMVMMDRKWALARRVSALFDVSGRPISPKVSAREPFVARLREFRAADLA